VRSAHFAHACAVAAELRSHEWSDALLGLLDSAAADLGELRRAFEALRDVDPVSAARLAGDLYPLWTARDLAVEGAGWLDEAATALRAAGTAETAEQVGQLARAGTLLLITGAAAEAGVQLRRAVDMAARLGERPPARAFASLAVLQMLAGDRAGALELIAAARQTDRDDEAAAEIERYLGPVLFLAGQVEEGIELCKRAVGASVGSPLHHAAALVNLAIAVGAQPELGVGAGREAVVAARRLGSRYYQGGAWGALGGALGFAGDRPGSCRALAESVALMLDAGARFYCLVGLDSLAAGLAEVVPADAVRLSAASAHLRAGPGRDGTWAERVRREMAARVAGTLGPGEFEQAWGAGRSLTLDAAVRLAGARVDECFALDPLELLD
jgi:tetratricopeptide (TPR) repeat protein